MKKSTLLVWFMGIAACGKAGGGLSHVTEPVGAADGTLEAWRALDPMPAPRANHCAVALNGWLVVIGGNHAEGGGFVATNDVAIARLKNGGDLGAWKTAGTTPSALTECTVVAREGRLWIIDAIWEGSFNDGKVWTATLSSSGELSEFVDAGPLPVDRRMIDSEAWIDGSGLHVFNAQVGGGISILSAPIAADGSLGTFTITDVLGAWRGRAQYAIDDGGRSWIAGGYLDASLSNVVVSDVFALPAAATTTAQSLATSSLPLPTAFGRGIAIDGWVFVAGGRGQVFGASGRSNVYAAPVNSTGGLGVFTPTAALPEGRVAFPIVLAGNWLYLTGGGFDAGGLDTVFVAKARQ